MLAFHLCLPDQVLHNNYRYLNISLNFSLHFCEVCLRYCTNLIEKKISWMDGQTDRGKTVYPPPPPGSGCIKKIHKKYLAKMERKILRNVQIPVVIVEYLVRQTKVECEQLLNHELKTGFTFFMNSPLPSKRIEILTNILTS